MHYASTSSSLASGSEAIPPERAAGCETLLAHFTFLADEWEGATGLEMAAAVSEVLVDHKSISEVLWPRAAGWPPRLLLFEARRSYVQSASVVSKARSTVMLSADTASLGGFVKENAFLPH